MARRSGRLGQAAVWRLAGFIGLVVLGLPVDAALAVSPAAASGAPPEVPAVTVTVPAPPAPVGFSVTAYDADEPIATWSFVGADGRTGSDVTTGLGGVVQLMSTTCDDPTPGPPSSTCHATAWYTPPSSPPPSPLLGPLTDEVDVVVSDGTSEGRAAVTFAFTPTVAGVDGTSTVPAGQTGTVRLRADGFTTFAVVQLPQHGTILDGQLGADGVVDPALVTCVPTRCTAELQYRADDGTTPDVVVFGARSAWGTAIAQTVILHVSQPPQFVAAPWGPPADALAPWPQTSVYTIEADDPDSADVTFGIDASGTTIDASVAPAACALATDGERYHCWTYLSVTPAEGQTAGDVVVTVSDGTTTTSLPIALRADQRPVLQTTDLGRYAGDGPGTVYALYRDAYGPLASATISAVSTGAASEPTTRCWVEYGNAEPHVCSIAWTYEPTAVGPVTAHLTLRTAAGAIGETDVRWYAGNTAPVATADEHPEIVISNDVPAVFAVVGTDADGDQMAFDVLGVEGGELIGVTSTGCTTVDTGVECRGAVELRLPASGGPLTFTYVARDGYGRVSEPATVVRTYVPVDEPVTITPLVTSVPEGGGSVAVSVGGNPPIAVTWDLDGDGVVDASGTEAYLSADIAADGPAVLPVVVRAVDADGDEMTLPIEVGVTNVAPYPGYLQIPELAWAGEPLTVTVVGARDVAADRLEYAFDCGDGLGPFGPEAQASCTITTGGLHQVLAVVRDDGDKADPPHDRLESTIGAYVMVDVPVVALAGTVRFADGAPAAGVSVWASGASATLAVVDASGRFMLEGLDFGATYTIWPEQPEGTAAFLPVAPITYTVDSLVPSSLDIVLDRPPVVTGTVVGGGQPLADVAVVLLRADDGSWAGYATTGTDGRYSVDSLLPGTYVVRIDGSGSWAGQYWPAVPTRTQASPITVVANEVRSDIDASLSSGGSVQGVVRDDSGVPVGQAWVSAGNGEFSRAYGPTDTDGRYTIVGLPTGAYTVTAGQAEPTALVPASQTGVVITAPSTTDGVDLVLGTDPSRWARLSGVVRTDSGVPVEGASVQLSIRGITTRTDAQGRYDFGLIVLDPEMNLTELVVTGPDGGGFAPYRWLLALEPGAASAHDVVLHAGGVIEGTITDDLGQPAVEVMVQLFAPDSPELVRVVRSDATGHYLLGPVPVGSYRLGFVPTDGTLLAEYHPDVSTLDQAAVITVTAHQVIDAALAADPSGPVRLSGTVTTAEGTPIAGASVRLYLFGPFAIDVFTDEAGHYDFDGSYLFPGTVRLAVEPPSGPTFGDLQPVDMTVALVGGHRVVVPIVLRPVTPPVVGALSGIVRDERGNALSGIVVMVEGPGIGVGAETGADGSYFVAALPVGTYAVVASGTPELPYLPATRSDVTVTADQTTSGVDFALAEDLDAATLVTGVVRLADGSPVAGVRVWVRALFGGEHFTTTAADGSYRLLVGVEDSVFPFAALSVDPPMGLLASGAPASFLIERGRQYAFDVVLVERLRWIDPGTLGVLEGVVPSTWPLSLAGGVGPYSTSFTVYADPDGDGAFDTPLDAGAAIDGASTLRLVAVGRDSSPTIQTVSDSWWVEVADVAPTVPVDGFVAPESVWVGDTIELRLAGVTDPSAVDQASLRYWFDCGDGAGYVEADVDHLTCAASTVPGERTLRARVAAAGTEGDMAVEAPARILTVRADVSPPTITAVADRIPNAAGWWNAPVTWTFTCADDTGVASCPAPVTVAMDGVGLSFTVEATDVRGNRGHLTITGIDLDRTAPTVVIEGIAEGATYPSGAVPVATCTASDVTSGLTGACTLNAPVPLGANRYSVTATVRDRADNVGQTTSTYTMVSAAVSDRDRLGQIANALGRLTLAPRDGLVRTVATTALRVAAALPTWRADGNQPTSVAVVVPVHAAVVALDTIAGANPTIAAAERELATMMERWARQAVADAVAAHGRPVFVDRATKELARGSALLVGRRYVAAAEQFELAFADGRRAVTG